MDPVDDTVFRDSHVGNPDSTFEMNTECGIHGVVL